MESKSVIIIGATGLGKVAYDIFNSNNVVVYCFLDDDKKLHDTEVGDVSVMGSSDNVDLLKLVGDSCNVFVASDEDTYRKNIVKRIKEGVSVAPINAFHANAYVSETADIGYGNLVNSGASINSFATVGNHNIINSGVIVDFEATVGDYVQIGTGSIINSGVTIEEGAFIGSGVTIVAGVTIGKKARIGAGSVVVADVKNGATVFGNPAQAIKK